MGQVYSEGLHTGYISHFSKTGCLCKTYDGILLLHENLTTKKRAKKLYFSVDATNNKDNDLIQLIESKLASGERVVIKYKEYYFVWPCRGYYHIVVHDIK